MGDTGLTHLVPDPFQGMMSAVSAGIPPFEVFYETHADVVLRLLLRSLGRDGAEDAFQETFLRALGAYGRLRHGDHLRSWVLTIATNVALDALRRSGREILHAEPPEPADAGGDQPLHSLAELTDGLPPKERAAVVLRYGYDLDYAQIAAALESSPVAARQAASAGVRRLRATTTRRSDR